MKKLTKKGTIHKIIVLIIIVLLLNFVAPTYSRANFGGVLMGPLIDFISGVGDVVMSALQFFMYDGNISLSGVASGAANTALTIINPFDSFLLERKSDQFEEKLAEYDADVTQDDLDKNDGNADITIDSSQFDKGWFSWLPGTWADKDYGIPIIKYTPEKIFSNQVPALDVNFISPRDWTDIKDESGNQKYENAELMNERSVTQALHSTIANWYVALRNLALVALLSVLLYVGIRMVLSSTASDKAKYKQMIMDWIIAICILMFLHYAMTLILTITQMVTEGVDSGTEIIVQVKDEEQGDFMFKTDLTGLCRFQVQYADLGARLIYLIFYIALVIYTLVFTWEYVKRAIIMAFLTLMAPLVAITYPIDKIGDGKAQAFGIWIREYVFNAILQPFHLIIYTIFLGAASEIATKNPIYAILFLAFIVPSEKLLRKMFGFEKSNTAGAMGAAAGMFGGAAVFKALSNTMGKRRGGSSGGAGSGKVRTKTPIKDNNEIGKDFSAFTSRSSNGGNLSSNVNYSNSLDGSKDDDMHLPSNSLPYESGQEDNLSYNDMYINPNAYMSRQARESELQNNKSNIKDPLIYSERGIQPPLGPVPGQYPSNANAIQGQFPRTANGGIQSRNSYGGQNYAGIDNPTIRNGIHTIDRNPGMREQGLRASAGRTPETTQIPVPQRDIRGIAKLGETAKKVGKGVKGAAKDGVRYTGRKLKHRFASVEGWQENAKFAARTAVRGVSAATMGAVGLGIGIAGGDLDDVLKYGAAGAALGGSVLGSKIIDKGGKVAHSANLSFQEGYYGSANAAAMARQTRQFNNNEDNREFFGTEFNVKGKELDTIMGRASELYNQGITDNKEIKQTIKLEDSIKKELKDSDMSEEERRTLAKQQAITIARISGDFDREKLMLNEDYQKSSYKRLESGIKKSQPDISKKDLKVQADQMMKLLRKYKKID